MALERDDNLHSFLSLLVHLNKRRKSHHCTTFKAAQNECWINKFDW